MDGKPDLEKFTQVIQIIQGNKVFETTANMQPSKTLAITMVTWENNNQYPSLNLFSVCDGLRKEIY